MASIWDHLMKIVCYLPCSILVTCFTVKLLNIRRPVRFICLVNLAEIIVYCPVMLFPTLPWVKTFNAVLQLVLYICPSLLVRGHSIPRRLLAGAMSFMTVLVGEVFSMLFFFSFGGKIDLNDIAYATQNIPLYIFYQTINFVGTYISIQLLSWLWKRSIQKVGGKTLWYFALFPITQALLFSLCILYAPEEGLSSARYLLMSMIAVLCIVADALLFRTIEKVTRSAILEERADWSEQLLLQQETHYAQILSDTEDASRIRHDIRNQLQTAYSLIAQGEHDSAKELLDGVVTQLERAPSFCAHPVVNALLTVKSEQFLESGIPLICNCSVPKSLPFEGVDLCSLFSNILDNAYHAAQGCTAPVTITAAIQSDFFILTCVNPIHTKPNPQQKRKGHGLGLTILDGIVQRYRGELHTEQSAQDYKIIVWLQLSEKD